MAPMLEISNVIFPSNPGSMKPAVTCIVTPKRPILERPSTLATKSSGTLTYSNVVASANSLGCIIKASPSLTVVDSMYEAMSSSSLGSMKGFLITLNTLNSSPNLMSTEDGCICFSSKRGSIDIFPSFKYSFIVLSLKIAIFSHKHYNSFLYKLSILLITLSIVSSE